MLSNLAHRCKKNVFYVFLFMARFFTFFNVFYFANVFFIKKRSLKIPSKITFETTETNWVCMIVFLCAHVRLSISTYILTSIVTYLPYRLILLDMHGNHHHQRTDLGGIMSITSVFTIGPFVPCTPLQNPKYATDVNMPSQTKWRNVGWKTSTVFIQRLQTFFFYFCHVFYVF